MNIIWSHSTQLKLIMLIFLTVTVTACAISYNAPLRPPMGIAISTIKAPLTTDFNGTTVSGDLIKASKKQTYYVHDILFTGLDFAWDTVDIPEIARQGGISEVAYAEYELLNVLGVYAQFTIHVYGK